MFLTPVQDILFSTVTGWCVVELGGSRQPRQAVRWFWWCGLDGRLAVIAHV